MADADTGNGVMIGADLAIMSALATAPIRLGNADAKFKLAGGALTIEELKTSGGDLTLAATGTIELGADPAHSTLAIQFTLAPKPTAVSRLNMLFALLPHPPNAQPYRLTGTLSAWRIS